MEHFKYSETREKGTYKPCFNQDGRKSAFIVCPDCGTRLHMNPHIVAANGTVSPSVVCHGDGCNFHDYVVLDGGE